MTYTRHVYNNLDVNGRAFAAAGVGKLKIGDPETSRNETVNEPYVSAGKPGVAAALLGIRCFNPHNRLYAREPWLCRAATPIVISHWIL